MAIPAMITQMGQQQLNYGMSVGQSLQRLGQQVGQQLAQKEYQRQAAEALPAMQESYKQAFDKIQRGNISEGYMDVLNTGMQFGSNQNPFLMGFIEQANKFAKEAGDVTLSQGWQNIQRGGGAASAMGGMGGFGGIDTGFEDAELPTEADFDSELPDMVGIQPESKIPTQLDIIDQVRGLAQGETNQKFAASLNLAAESATDPAKEELRKEVASNFKDYNKLSEAQQRKQFNARLFDVNKTDVSNSYMIPGAERIMGKGVKGIYFKPGFGVSGLTSKGQPAFKKQDLGNIAIELEGAISKLNEGELGEFLGNAGGALNTRIKTETIKSTRRSEPDTTVVKIVDNKGGEYVLPPDSEEIKRIRIAHDYVKNIPAVMRSFKESDAGYLFSPAPTVRSEGPTRQRSTGRPISQQPSGQRPPLGSFFGVQ